MITEGKISFNFEHLLESSQLAGGDGADWAAQVLRGTPEVTILATSCSVRFIAEDSGPDVYPL